MKIKNLKRMDKKGYYRFSDIGMFFISFAIIAIGITAGIYMFYSQNLDIRDDEAKILFDKLKNAVFKDGKLREEVLEDNFNIYDKADIDKELINNKKLGFFYFKIEISEPEKPKKKIEGGAPSFEIECELPGDKLVTCKDRRWKLDSGIEVYILAGSNQKGESI